MVLFFFHKLSFFSSFMEFVLITAFNLSFTRAICICFFAEMVFFFDSKQCVYETVNY